jgi:hypothetical protein
MFRKMALLPSSGLLRWVLLIELVPINILFTLKMMDKVQETSGSQSLVHVHSLISTVLDSRCQDKVFQTSYNNHSQNLICSVMSS